MKGHCTQAENSSEWDKSSSFTRLFFLQRDWFETTGFPPKKHKQTMLFSHHVFPRFCQKKHAFPPTSHGLKPKIVPHFPHVPQFSHKCPMVFPWFSVFSYTFSMVFPWFSVFPYTFSMVFPWFSVFSYTFSMVETSEFSHGSNGLRRQDEGATWATEKLQKSEADWQIMAPRYDRP